MHATLDSQLMNYFAQNAPAGRLSGSKYNQGPKSPLRDDLLLFPKRNIRHWDHATLDSQLIKYFAQKAPAGRLSGSKYNSLRSAHTRRPAYMFRRSSIRYQTRDAPMSSLRGVDPWDPRAPQGPPHKSPAPWDPRGHKGPWGPKGRG